MQPYDIRQKEFSSSTFGGFNKKEVIDFLNKVADEFTAIQQKLAALQSSSQQAIDNVPNLVKTEMDKKQDLINKALILAEKTATEAVENAKNEAKNIVAAANTEAESRLNEANALARKTIEDAQDKARKTSDEARQYLSVIEHNLVQIKEEKRVFLMNLKAQLETLLKKVDEDSKL